MTQRVPEGAYHRLVLEAPSIAAAARPGQFVAIAVGERPTAMVLRRSFSIAIADAATGVVELLVAARGPGTVWLTERQAGDQLELGGPLGRPFPDPDPGAGCVLVGGGYGAAPMVWWAWELLSREIPVALVLGAATAERLADVDAARSLGVPVFVTTEDGSAGTTGRVTDVLAEALEAVGAAGEGDSGGATTEDSPVRAEIYGCGPMAMLRALQDAAERSGGRAWCAVEEAMACGVGVCMTCVLPVRGADGVTRMTRTCVDGPTFDGSAIRWDAITIEGGHARAGVPTDCLGAT